MLSRVAEAMFWMSRYVERAENTARYLDVSFHLRLDLTNIAGSDQYWRHLVEIAGDPVVYERDHLEYHPETVTEHLVFSRDNPFSIASSVWYARENARSMIESISSEMWEQVNSLYHSLQSTNARSVTQDPYKFYREVKMGSHLFQGITDSTMLRSEGWEFVQVGKYVERAINTARLLDAQHAVLNPSTPPVGTANVIQWMGVLKSCSALEAFCKAHRSNIESTAVLRFLILDRAFPRSLYFAVAAAEASLWNVSGSSRHRYANSADRLIGKIGADMSYATIEDILETGVHEYLYAIQRRLEGVGDQIHRIYFAYHIPDVDDDDAPLPRLELARDQARRSHAEQQQQTKATENY